MEEPVADFCLLQGLTCREFGDTMVDSWTRKRETLKAVKKAAGLLRGK